MNYIIGKRFKPGYVAPRRSLQEQLARRNTINTLPDKNTSSLFIPGEEYTIYYIKPSKNTNNETIYEYFFKSSQNKIITMQFNNTAEADDFIAQLCSETDNLKSLRQQQAAEIA